MAMIHVSRGPWENVPLSNDLLVTIKDSCFRLHFPFLVLRSGFFASVASNAPDGLRKEVVQVDLSKLPGGEIAFHEIANFCYDEEMKLSPTNILPIYCAASYLEMVKKKSSSGQDFFDIINTYFDEYVFSNWKDSIAVLRTVFSDASLSSCKEIEKVQDRCEDAILMHASRYQDNMTLEKSNDASEIFQTLIQQPIPLLQRILELFREKNYAFLDAGNIMAENNDSWLLSSFHYSPEPYSSPNQIPTPIEPDYHARSEPSHSHKITAVQEVLSFLISMFPSQPSIFSIVEFEFETNSECRLPTVNYVRVLIKAFATVSVYNASFEPLASWLAYCSEKERMLQLKERERRTRELERELEEKEALVMEKEENLNLLEKKMMEIKSRAERTMKDLDVLKQQAMGCRVRLDGLEEENISLKDDLERVTYDQNSELREYRSKVDVEEGKIRELESELNHLKVEKRMDQSRNTALESENRKLISQLKMLRSQLEVKSKKCVRSFKGHNGTVLSMAVNEEGLVFTGGVDNLIKCWNNGELMRVLSGHSSHVYSLVFDEDGDLWSGSSDCMIKRWRNNACIETLAGHKSHVLSLAYSKFDKFLWSGSKDFCIKAWHGGRCTSTILTPSSVRTLEVTDDGVIWSGGWDGIVRGWIDGKCVYLFETGANGWVCALAVDPTVSEIWSGNRNQRALLRWKAGKKFEHEWPGSNDGYVSALTFHDGTLWSGHSDRKIRAWLGRKCVASLDGHLTVVCSIAVTPNGTLWSGDEDGTIKVWVNVN